MADSREDHLSACKARALEYANAGDLVNAVSSMVSDLGKHEKTVSTLAEISVGVGLAANGDKAGLIHWIEGFC